MGSLALFLRKVYLLASRRLRGVCSTLNISDELRLKIWTCLEHSLVHHAELMRDRHLNTFIMCAIYIMAKVSKEEIPFKHIMNTFCVPRAGRMVPSAAVTRGGNAGTASSIREASEEPTGLGSGFATPRPSPSPGSAVGGAGPGPAEGERTALLHFYNTVYMTQMHSFAVLYSPSALARAGAETPPYSPFPSLTPTCPRRIRLRPSFYVSPLDASVPRSPPPGHARRALYFINSSSPGCLRDINNMLKAGPPATRRRPRARLQAEEEEPPARRARCEGPSAWQRRLRELATEQAQSRAQNRAQNQAQNQARNQAQNQNQAPPPTRPHV